EIETCLEFRRVLFRSLSQRELSDQLAERGYRISRTMIRWYAYAVDTLHPLIPTVLQAGIGRPQIQRIHELQSAFGKAWHSLDLRSEERRVGKGYTSGR